MPKAATSKPRTNARRAPVFPINLRVPSEVARLQPLWPWYMAPFEEPPVTDECRAWVMGEYEPDEDEKSLLLAEFVGLPTIRSDAPMVIRQWPGACATERQYYAREGWRLITPASGDSSGNAFQPLVMWPPQMEDGSQIGAMYTDPFIGLNTVVASLHERQKWALVQIDSKIEEATEKAKDERYYRAIVTALKRRRKSLEIGIPTVKELQSFFLRCERLRLEGQRDARVAEQAAIQQRVQVLSNQEQAVMAEIEAQETTWEGPE